MESELYIEFLELINKDYTRYDVFKFVILNLDKINFIKFVHQNNNSWKIVNNIKHYLSFEYIPENYYIAYKKLNDNKCNCSHYFCENEAWKVITCGYYYDNNKLVPDNLKYKININYNIMSDSQFDYLVSFDNIFN